MYRNCGAFTVFFDFSIGVKPTRRLVDQFRNTCMINVADGKDEMDHGKDGRVVVTKAIRSRAAPVPCP